MAIISNNCKIYFGKEHHHSLAKVQAYCARSEVPSFEKIGAIHHRLKTLLSEKPSTHISSIKQAAAKQAKKEEITQLFSLMGIDPSQQNTIEKLTQLYLKIIGKGVEITPINEHENTGVFVFKSDQMPVGIFKLGIMRTRYEMLFKRLADLLGLSDHAISVMFGVLENPPIVETDDGDDTSGTPEVLWNGKEKDTYTPVKKMVGVFEPFLHGNQEGECSLLNFTRTVLLALAAGARDQKADAMIIDELGIPVLADNEIAFPDRVDPTDQTKIEDIVAATDIHFLANPLATKYLSQDDCFALKKLVDQWDVFDTCSKLNEEMVLFFDKNAETKKSGKDDTGTQFTVNQGVPDKLKMRSIANVSSKTEVFARSQINATMLRLTRIQSYIVEQVQLGQVFRPIDLVYTSDPFFKIYEKRALAVLGDKNNRLRNQEPSVLLGRTSPKELISLTRSSDSAPLLFDSLRSDMSSSEYQELTRVGASEAASLISKKTFHTAADSKSSSSENAEENDDFNPFEDINDNHENYNIFNAKLEGINNYATYANPRMDHLDESLRFEDDDLEGHLEFSFDNAESPTKEKSPYEKSNVSLDDELFQPFDDMNLKKESPSKKVASPPRSPLKKAISLFKASHESSDSKKSVSRRLFSDKK